MAATNIYGVDCWLILKGEDYLFLGKFHAVFLAPIETYIFLDVINCLKLVIRPRPKSYIRKYWEKFKGTNKSSN